MIDLYYWTTPNGHKLTMFLEETGLAVRAEAGQHLARRAVRAGVPRDRAEQPHPRDRRSRAGRSTAGRSALFESGAILLYLAEKTGRLIPADLRARWQCIQWLFWQMAGSGPMAGQNHHFGSYAIEPIPYAIDRYVNETGRLYAVLDRAAAPIASSSSATTRSPTSRAIRGCNPSARSRTSTTFPHLKRWKESIAARPATQRAYAIAQDDQREAGDQRRGIAQDTVRAGPAHRALNGGRSCDRTAAWPLSAAHPTRRAGLRRRSETRVLAKRLDDRHLAFGKIRRPGERVKRVAVADDARCCCLQAPASTAALSAPRSAARRRCVQVRRARAHRSVAWPNTSSAVSRVRQNGLASTVVTGMCSRRIAAPIARASARPRSVRLRCCAQSSYPVILSSFWPKSVAPWRK